MEMAQCLVKYQAFAMLIRLEIETCVASLFNIVLLNLYILLHLYLASKFSKPYVSHLWLFGRLHAWNFSKSYSNLLR